MPVVRGRVCMLPSGLVTPVQDAITRAQDHLLSIQAPDGHWTGTLEADRALTAEYLLLSHLIERCDELDLYLKPDDSQQTLHVSAYVTTLIMNYLFTGKFKRTK